MAIHDFENLMENELAITVSRAGENAIDLGVVGGRKIGPGETVQVDLVVTEAFTAAGAATMQIDLVSDDAAALTSPTVVRSTIAIPKATLVPGYHITFAVPVEEFGERYIGVDLTVATGPMTAGKLSGGIVMEGGIQTAKSDWTAVTGF